MENTIKTAVFNQVVVAGMVNDKNNELKTKTREIITLAIAENVKHAEFISTMKEIYVNHVTWPMHNSKKVGENAARNSAAGKGFNSLASLFRQLFTHDDNGMIREKTKEEKAPKKKATVEPEDAPERVEEMPLAAKLESFTAEQLAGMLLAKCENNLKDATKVLKSVSAK